MNILSLQGMLAGPGATSHGLLLQQGVVQPTTVPGIAVLIDLGLFEAKAWDMAVGKARLLDEATGVAVLDEQCGDATVSDEATGRAEVSDELLWRAELDEEPING